MNLNLLAQAGQLEITYPEIFGAAPQTVAFGIAEYAKYIFNFSIALIGFIAFAVLIYAGFRYLTSTGKPDELKKAKDQIRSAVFGILLLLFSYLILTTINPQLTVFELPQIELPEVFIPEPSVPPPFLQDPLARIRSLAKAVKTTAGLIKNPALETKNLTDNCDCSTTQPLCLTEDYYGSCEAEYCYAAEPEQPCPDIESINLNRQRVVDLRDLILYYKNRARAEAEDLKDEVEKIIDEKIKFLEARVLSERETLDRCETEICQELQQRIIASLEEDLEKLQEEKTFKNELGDKLLLLADEIEKIKEPATELASLPDDCLKNVSSKCTGSCSGGGHDTPGCFPEECSGGNPCPTDEIQNRLDEINSVSEEIKRIADEIITMAPGVPGVVPPPEEIPECDNPQELAQKNNVPFPRTNTPQTEAVLNYIKSKLAGQNLGEISTYDKSHDICNYTRGQKICGPCSHVVYSCHYGGAAGSQGSLAIDFGNEDIGSAIIQAAQEHGVKSARCETGNGVPVPCSNLNASHVHITVNGCDRN